MPKVLIVDDEPSIRLTLSAFLGREGFETLAAADAAQAVDLFDAHGDVDVAVVDVNLPGRSGIELLRELAGRGPYVPIIMITGEPNISHLPEIVRSGAYDFIAKPVVKDVIIRAVAHAAEQRRLREGKRRLEQEVKQYAEELERRVAERTAELAEAHNFLNLVLDSSTEYAIVVVDTEARITLFNRGAELLFGYPAAEVLGRQPRELFIDVGHYGEDVLLSALREADTAGRFQTELRLHRKGGAELPASVVVTPMMGGRLLGHLCVIHDLTAERQAEESLRRMQARLAHHEKIAALGRVAAQVAHEVKNPLAGLLLYATHLKGKLAGRVGKDELGIADRIIETINHLTNTVNQIMNFARPLSLEPRGVDLNGVVANVLQLLGPQLAAAGVETRQEPEDESMCARLDESSFRSALTNLVLNALQAMPGGGRLSVKTGREADWLRVEVEDTGTGMTEEQLRNVFEAFYTTKSQGLGLGLPYARKVVEQHGGRIGVESRAGAGTTVRIYLPAAQGGG